MYDAFSNSDDKILCLNTLHPALQNGPFYNAKVPILASKSAYFATRKGLYQKVGLRYLRLST